MFYETLALEWLMDPQGAIKLLRASYWHLLDFPIHFQLQKVEACLAGWLLKMMWSDRNVLIPVEKVNRNYRRVKEWRVTLGVLIST